MQPDEADRAFLWDVLDAARSIQALVSSMTFEQFRGDRRTYRAVERELEIMGEAARSVSSSLRAAHPEIPWVGIIGQRNVLAHQYGRIRYDVLWETITGSLPTLIRQLGALSPSSPADPGGESKPGATPPGK